MFSNITNFSIPTPIVSKPVSILKKPKPQLNPIDPEETTITQNIQRTQIQKERNIMNISFENQQIEPVVSFNTADNILKDFVEAEDKAIFLFDNKDIIKSMSNEEQSKIINFLLGVSID